MNAQRVEAALAAEIRAGTYLLALSPSEIEAIIAAADEAVGGVVPRETADELAEALKLAHGCLREVRRDFDAPINGVIDEVYDALVAYDRDATRDATA